MQAMFAVKNRVFLSNRSDHQSLGSEFSVGEHSPRGCITDELGQPCWQGPAVPVAGRGVLFVFPGAGLEETGEK